MKTERMDDPDGEARDKSAFESGKEPRHFSLELLVDCSADRQEALRVLRNRPEVRSFMYSDHEISRDEHAAWIARLKDDKRQLVFGIFDGSGALAGMVSASQIDRQHRRADWAFYLDPSQRGGLGSVIEFHFLSYVFDVLKLDKLNCEVISRNESVISLHKKFGFVVEGVRRSHVVKGGQRCDVHLLGITRAEWGDLKSAMAESLAPLLRRFSLRFPAESGA